MAKTTHLDNLDLAKYMDLADKYRDVNRVPKGLIDAIDALVGGAMIDRLARMPEVQDLRPRQYDELMTEGWRERIAEMKPFA